MAESEVLKLGARPLRLADLRRVYAGPVCVAGLSTGGRSEQSEAVEEGE